MLKITGEIFRVNLDATYELKSSYYGVKQNYKSKITLKMELLDSNLNSV